MQHEAVSLWEPVFLCHLSHFYLKTNLHGPSVSLQNYFARNFYNMRLLALFVAFAINFILLFYKVRVWSLPTSQVDLINNVIQLIFLTIPWDGGGNIGLTIFFIYFNYILFLSNNRISLLRYHPRLHHGWRRKVRSQRFTARSRVLSPKTTTRPEFVLFWRRPADTWSRLSASSPWLTPLSPSAVLSVITAWRYRPLHTL